MRHLAVATWISLSALANAKVGTIDLSELARRTSIVVIADVRTVETIGGVKIASADVVSRVKGKPVSQVFFVAQPTWNCDISRAAPGERVLLFLDEIRAPRNGSPELQSAIQEIARRGDSLYLIAHSGRGQIPLRKAHGWSASVEHKFDKRWELEINLVLPKGTPVRKVTARTGRVELSDMLTVIGKATRTVP